MFCRWYLGLTACWLATGGLLASGAEVMPAAPSAPLRVGPANQVAANAAPTSLTSDAEEEEEEEEDEPEEESAKTPAPGRQTGAIFPLSNPFSAAGNQSNCLLGGCGKCDRCRECGPPRGFYARSEILYWWVQGMSVPPLVTTSPAGTTQAAAGVLPGATTLFGGGGVNGQGRPGARVTVGYWFDAGETLGIESTTFGLQTTNTSFNSGVSDGTPILARPFFNTLTNAQDAQLVAYPGLLSGQINTQASTKTFGTEVNLRKALFGGGNRRLDGLIGYRFARFDEGLETDSLSMFTGTGGGVPQGTTFNIHDSFGTQNMFNGLNFGARWMYDRGGRLSFDLLGKTALGVMHEKVSIDGGTVVTEPGMTPIVQSGGILALPQSGGGGNIGTYTRNRFAAIPEANLNIYYQLTGAIRLNVGYSLMYMTNVARPGNQIDTKVNPDRFPPPIAGGGPNPTFLFNDTSVWLQGVSLGLEGRF